MSHIKENFEQEGKLPSFYRRYVDDTLTTMPKIETASNFLDKLNKAHSSVKFTMETKCNGILPFLGVQLLNQSPQREKGGLKTHQFRSTLALSESCWQSLRRGLTENYAQLREYWKVLRHWIRVTDFQAFRWLLKEPTLEGLDLLTCPKIVSTTVHIFIPTWYVKQGSNLKTFLSRLLATIQEKMVAKCKNAVAR